MTKGRFKRQEPRGKISLPFYFNNLYPNPKLHCSVKTPSPGEGAADSEVVGRDLLKRAKPLPTPSRREGIAPSHAFLILWSSP